MTPQVPNDHIVEFVDQMAAEKLKDQTKSKPALASGLYLAQGHRHETILPPNASWTQHKTPAAERSRIECQIIARRRLRQ
jgi:hypothetical protein